MVEKPDIGADRHSHTLAAGNKAALESGVRAELQVILASEQFASSRRSCDLLRYLVEHALHGELDRLKERCIGVELFQRDPQYETSHDAIVRVAASDLRKRLGEYYKAASHPPVRIRLPIGMYIPEFELLPKTSIAKDVVVTPPAVPLPDRTNWVPALIVLCAILAVALAISLTLIPARAKTVAAPMVGPPWPLSRVLDDQHKTVIVLADANAGMLGVLRGAG